MSFESVYFIGNNFFSLTMRKDSNFFGFQPLTRAKLYILAKFYYICIISISRYEKVCSISTAAAAVRRCGRR